MCTLSHKDLKTIPLCGPYSKWLEDVPHVGGFGVLRCGRVAYGRGTQVKEGQSWKILGTKGWGGTGHWCATEGQQVWTRATEEYRREIWGICVRWSVGTLSPSP